MSPALRDGLALAAIVAVTGTASQWWTGRQQDAFGPQLAALARPGDIRMLSSDTCGVCASTRAYFRAHRVAYSECSIERDERCRADFEASRAPGTPVMVVRGQASVGFSAQRLVALLGGKA